MKLIKDLLPLVVVLVVGIFSVWPAVINLGTIADYGTDGELIVWITNQTVQNITGNIRNFEGDKIAIWGGQAFYPYKNVLGYSDLFFISGILAAIPVIFIGNPAITAGMGIIVGQLLTMVMVYVWGKELTGNKWSAMVVAVILGWAQFRWHYQVHLQMWNMQYFLGSIFCFWKWIKTDKIKWGIGSGILLGVQAWESVLPVYFGVTVMIIILISNYKFLMTKRCQNLKRLFLIGLLALGIMLPVLLMYAGISREFQYERSIREAANNGLSVNDTYSWFGSWGIIALLVVAIMKIQSSSLKVQYKKEIKLLVVVMIVGYVMALGPTLKWGGKTVKVAGLPIPLPYAVAYYTVPGFGALRTPSRWIWLSGFAVTMIIAVGLSKSQISNTNKQTNSKFKKSKFNIVLGLVGCLAVARLGGVSLTKYRVFPKPEEYPAVYKWLKTQTGQIILELPRGIEAIEHERMVYSVWTGKTLVNGSSGFNPPEVNVKPDYVIIHEDQCLMFKVDCVGEGVVVWKDKNTVVYKL